MRKATLGFLCLAMFGGSAWCGLALWRTRPLTLTAKPDFIDLGNIPQGDEARSEFTLANETGDVVEITNVAKSCSCHTVLIDEKVLEPGTATKVQFRWGTKSSRGKQSAEFLVFFRSPGRPEKNLKLVTLADIRPDIEFGPAELQFGIDKPKVGSVSLRPGRMERFDVLDVFCDHPAFSVALQPGGRDVQVTFDPLAWDRPDRQPRLFIKTTSVNEPTILLPLKVLGLGESAQEGPSGVSPG